MTLRLYDQECREKSSANLLNMKSGGERVGNEKHSVAVGHRELQYRDKAAKEPFIYLVS